MAKDFPSVTPVRVGNLDGATTGERSRRGRELNQEARRAAQEEYIKNRIKSASAAAPLAIPGRRKQYSKDEIEQIVQQGAERARVYQVLKDHYAQLLAEYIHPILGDLSKNTDIANLTEEDPFIAYLTPRGAYWGRIANTSMGNASLCAKSTAFSILCTRGRWVHRYQSHDILAHGFWFGIPDDIPIGYTQLAQGKQCAYLEYSGSSPTYAVYGDDVESDPQTIRRKIFEVEVTGYEIGETLLLCNLGDIHTW